MSLLIVLETLPASVCVVLALLQPCRPPFTLCQKLCIFWRKAFPTVQCAFVPVRRVDGLSSYGVDVIKLVGVRDRERAHTSIMPRLAWVEFPFL